MATSRSDAPRKRSWIVGKHKEKDSAPSGLPTPQEGQELSVTRPIPSGTSSTSAISTHTPASGGGLPFKRSSSSTSLDSSTTSRPVTPTNRRWSSTTSLLTRQELDQQASQIILNALERSTSQAPASKPAETKTDKDKAPFAKMSLSSMMGGFSSLSLSRSRDERGRGRTKEKGKEKRARSSSFAGRDDPTDTTLTRARSQSPFTLRRVRTRDTSPDVQALRGEDLESDSEVNRIRPRNAFSAGSSAHDDDDSGSGDEDDDDSSES